jgi:regulator of sirC expression with transglutaminase-like and TPR domain
MALASDGSLLERLLAVERDHEGLCPEASRAEVVREQIRDLTATLRTRFERVVEPDGAPLKTAGSRAERAVQALNRSIFEDFGMRPSRDVQDSCNLLLTSVLKRKQGYCVGVAALYLVLAETLELPIRAVATPSHIFLRYDDGKTRINIETFQGGAALPDEQYVVEQKIAPVSIRRGVFLRGLTDDEFIAHVRNNLGVVHSHQENYTRAAREYEAALRLHRDFPAAWYNRAKDLQRQGDYAPAIRCFSKALRLHPNDVWALNNRGLAYREIGRRDKARRDYEAALAIDPDFELARRNLEHVSGTE